MINNNNLQHVSSSLDELMIDMTVKCMLNPNNKDFYIGTLTLDKVKSMFTEMNSADLDILTIFWEAYSRAEALYVKEQARIRDIKLNDMCSENFMCCPNCSCTQSLGYVPGVACPNCDYIEEV